MEGWALAYYFDGRSAGRTPVRIELDDAGLRLVSAADNAVVADWPYAELREILPARPGQAGQFGHVRDEEIRLSVPDAGMFAALADRVSRHRPRPHHARRYGIPAVIGAAALLVVAGLWFASPQVLDLIAEMIPRSMEARLGRAAMGEFERFGPVCTNKEGQAALDRLVAALARAAGGDATFSVQVKRSTTVNAFAVPGGTIVFLSGLIDKAETPDEVAGVLAHEMAHVDRRHPTRLMLRYFGLSLLASLMLGDSRLTDAVGLFGVLAYSREFEAEADARGIEILKTAGIRTSGIATFFGRMEKKEGGSATMMRYFTTHPPTAERRAMAERAAGGGNPAMSNEDWTALRSICKQG